MCVLGIDFVGAFPISRLPFPAMRRRALQIYDIVLLYFSYKLLVLRQPFYIPCKSDSEVVALEVEYKRASRLLMGYAQLQGIHKLCLLEYCNKVFCCAL